MPKTPVMVTGLRAPYDVRKEQAAAHQSIAATPVLNPEVGTVYISKHKSYRISLVPPRHTEIMPGVFDDTPGVNAIFTDGVYVNKGDGDPAKRELYDKLLQRNPWFGPSRDFWLASTQRAKEEKAAIDTVVQAVRANPEAMKTLVEQLRSEGALDWTMPAPPTAEPEPAKKTLVNRLD